jgi:hypothetical protein
MCEIHYYNSTSYYMSLSTLFYVHNKDTYPPFKHGLYLEEYFHAYHKDHPDIKTKRTYIPVLWTNFQIEGWFKHKKNLMQTQLNQWISENPNPHGYYTVVQYDDGPLLTLPENTIVFGACSGTTPLPLIYQDLNNTLIKTPTKTFNEKEILCSFVGSVTHGVRNMVTKCYGRNKNFKLSNNKGWTPVVDKQKQNTFINTTVNSKFALAPRGYGRSSFRYFEIFKLKTIPVYIWDDIEWLPYMDVIDYSTFCISINVSQIEQLEQMLLAIDEDKYNEMIDAYENIKDKFELEYMCEYIMKTDM